MRNLQDYIQNSDQFVGWRPELKDEDYHAFPALSNGQCKTINDSISKFHYEVVLGNKREATPAMKLGSATHSMVLQSSIYLPKYRVSPDVDKRTKAGKDEFNKWFTDLPEDALVVSPSDDETITGIAQSIMKHDEAPNWIAGAIPEVAGFFHHEGLYFKFKPDLIANNAVLLDLKTTKKAKDFGDIIWWEDYDAQAYLYCIGASYILKREIKQFMFMFVEKEAPYDVAIVPMSSTMFDEGKKKIDQAIFKLKKAMETNVWIPYPGIQPAAVPPNTAQYRTYENEFTQ